MPTASPSQSQSRPEVSIIVPVRNEAGNIPPLVAAISRVFAKRKFEMIIINDSSNDASLAELERAMAAHPQLRVLTHSQPAGQSAALRNGILVARSPVIATLDGDGQNLPQDIPRLENAYRHVKQKHSNGANVAMVMVVGVRQRRQDSWLKRRASAWASHWRRWLLGDSHPDSGCGLKFFDRDLFLRMPYFENMHRFMTVLAVREGALVVPVPIGHARRRHGQSKYRILDRLAVGVVDIIGVWWLLRRSRKNLTIRESKGKGA